MKIVTFELTEEEYAALTSILKRMRVETTEEHKSKKKWIHDGIYLVNIETGSRINKYTKHHE